MSSSYAVKQWGAGFLHSRSFTENTGFQVRQRRFLTRHLKCLQRNDEQQYPPGHLFHTCTEWEEPRLWGGHFSFLEGRTFKHWDQLPLEVMFSLLWSHLARGAMCVPPVGWEGAWNDLIWEFKSFYNPQTSLQIKTQDELVAGRAGKGRQGLFQEAPLGSGSLS